MPNAAWSRPWPLARRQRRTTGPEHRIDSQGGTANGLTEQVSFPGRTGARLSGVLHKPEGPAAGSVLPAHRFTCSKDLHTMTRMATGLCEAGYAVPRFDVTGIGDSAGDFVDKAVTRNVVDLVQAATRLIRLGHGPCAVVGHSGRVSHRDCSTTGELVRPAPGPRPDELGVDR